MHKASLSAVIVLSFAASGCSRSNADASSTASGNHTFAAAVDRNANFYTAMTPDAMVRAANSMSVACTQVPTANEIAQATGDFSKRWTTKQALVNLTAGIGNLDLSGSDYYWVSMYEWSKSCETSDPNVEIVYGWRLIVTISGNEAQFKANATLPMIAGNATLSKSEASVHAVTQGVTGPKYTEMVTALDNTALDVEHFATVRDKLSITAAVLDTSAVHTPQKLYVVDKSTLRTDLARGFAMSQIVSGTECLKAALPQPLLDLQGIVRDTYEKQGVSCTPGTKPSEQQKLQAQLALSGLVVKKP